MRVLIVTALITALIGGLCVAGVFVAIDRGQLVGSGTVVSEQFPAAGVTRVEIDGPGRLVVVQGEAAQLTITTDDNILEAIETEIDGDVLAISYDRSGFTTLSRIRPSEEILFGLTVPTLAAIEVNGTADVEIDGFQAPRLAIEVDGLGDATLMDLRVDELDISLNGASTFDVAGTVQRQTIAIDGTGNYRAANLASREAVVDIDGDGDATVRVSETLDVEIDGRGTVEYIGSPTVTQDVSGDGEVRQVGDEAVPPGSPVASPAATPRAATPRAATPTPLALNVFRDPTPTPDD